MKTIVIFLAISGILFIYFIVNAEKSILVKGNEVTPAGTDIPKLILNKVKSLMQDFTGGKPENSINSVGPVINDIIKSKAEELKNKSENLASDAISAMTDLIKNPIENKINETLCPIK